MSGKSVFGSTLMLLLGISGGWLMRAWDAGDFRENKSLPQPEKSGERSLSSPDPQENAGVPLDAAFRNWSASPELEGASIGFCVLDESGKFIYASPLAETALCPASALKTLTAGAAFGILGEDFRFSTTLEADGGISPSGNVSGNLTLRGGGDPTLAEKDLVALAEEAVKRGLKRVEGRLSVDATVFPENPVSDHWVWGDLGNAYGTGAFGLNLGHNIVLLSFDGGRNVGDPATFLGSVPGLKGMEWDAQVTTGPAGSGDRVTLYSSPYASLMQALGTVPAGARGFSVRGAVPNPPRLAGDIVKIALERLGVVFEGRETSGKTQEIIASHESAPLPEIIDHMQEVSDNLEAQCLFLMMGVKRNADPVTVLRSYWENAGVEFKGLRLIDGSGLARATMIRPVDLARANFIARKSAYGERYLTSLPPAGNFMRSKRGAMSGVRTETGFITRDGKEYTFALMANGLGSVDFWRLRMELLENVGK